MSYGPADMTWPYGLSRNSWAKVWNRMIRHGGAFIPDSEEKGVMVWVHSETHASFTYILGGGAGFPGLDIWATPRPDGRYDLHQESEDDDSGAGTLGELANRTGPDDRPALRAHFLELYGADLPLAEEKQ